MDITDLIRKILLCVLTLFLWITEGYMIYKVIAYFRLKKTGIPCTAEITGFDVRYGRTKDIYYPYIRFTDTQGIEHNVCSESGMRYVTKRYQKGAELKLYYSEDDPEKHYIIVPNTIYSYLGVLVILTPVDLSLLGIITMLF